MMAGRVEDSGETSKFHEAMRKILKILPEEQLTKFHPFLGVVHMWRNPGIHEVFPITPDISGKDAKRSAEYRKKGNKLFQEKKFDEALEMFNISVMFAPFPKEMSQCSEKGECEEEPALNGTHNDEDRKSAEAKMNGNVEEPKKATAKVEQIVKENGAASVNGETSSQNGSNKKRNNQKKNRKRKSRNDPRKGDVVSNGGEECKCCEQESRPVNGETSAAGDEKADKEPQNGPTAKGSIETKDAKNDTSDKRQAVKAKTEDNHAMSFVIANRSACLFFLHLYKECIDDVDLAFTLGYPDELAYKLHERKAKCLIQLGRGQEAIESLQKATMSVADAKMDEKAKQNTVFSLGKQIKQIKDGKLKIKNLKSDIQFTMEHFPDFTAKPSPKFPCASAAFKMEISDERGRHVMAGEDVSVAEMVSYEEPYSSILYPEYYTTHCNRCLCRVVVATPCRDCSNVIYCSAPCEQKAWDSYHQVECPVLSWLHPTWVGRLGHLAFRTMLIAGYTNLKTYFSNDSESATLKRMSAFNNDGTYSLDYNSIYHLVHNITSRTPENIFNFALIALLLMKVYFVGVACLFKGCGIGVTDFLMGGRRSASTSGNDSQQQQKMAPVASENAKPEEPSGGPSQKQLEVLSLALMHHLQIIQCNGFAIPEMQGKDDFRTYVPRDIGVGLYPVHGLINHSCDPGLDICFYGNKMVTRAIKGIAKGKEITVDYGVLYFTQPKEARQGILRQQYYFECRCPACEGDWPLWQVVESVNPTFRCGSCRAPLPAAPPGSPVPSHVICPGCSHETAVLQNLSLLNESHQRYAIAMKIKGESENDSILLALIDHLALMDKLICTPWRDFVSCQSSVKQSFRLMGNWFRVRGEIPVPE